MVTTLKSFGGHGILKTRRLGYDGKGQIRISPDNERHLFAAEKMIDRFDCILEGLVDFRCEVSVIGARSPSGEIKTYDPTENIHRNGILYTSSVPAKISDAIVDQVKNATHKILEEALDYVGVIGVEFLSQTKKQSS